MGCISLRRHCIVVHMQWITVVIILCLFIFCTWSRGYTTSSSAGTAVNRPRTSQPGFNVKYLTVFWTKEGVSNSFHQLGAPPSHNNLKMLNLLGCTCTITTTPALLARFRRAKWKSTGYCLDSRESVSVCALYVSVLFTACWPPVPQNNQ